MQLSSSLPATVLATSLTSISLAFGAGPPPDPGPQEGAPAVILVTDFGARPDSRIDAVRGVRAALEACREASPATLVFHGRMQPLTLEGCRNVVVEENRIADDVLGRNIATAGMDAAEVTIGEGQNLQSR